MPWNHATAAVLVVVVALAAGLAGCGRPAPGPAFDGDAALGFVVGLVTGEDGRPRPRVPGTPGHEAAAIWLHAAMQVEGWTVAWQNFTGSEYDALDKGAVASYRTNAAFCSEEDEQQLADLAFSNLVAEWPGDGDGRLLLGAHWESKEEASEDPDEPSVAVVGANDGASGVGLVLQFMRHVAAGDVALSGLGLRVVFFDGEDGFEDCHPLAGSIVHARGLGPGEVDRMILLDMVGDADARYPREGRSVDADPALVDLLWEHGRALGGDAHFVERHCPVLDDHVPFIEEGVAAVDIIDFGRGASCSFPPYWHTADDVPARLSAPMLGLVGQTLWWTLEDERLRSTWPT